MNLFETKLSVPPLRSRLVHRPQLTAKLDTGFHGRLTLVSAPAGYGKTTLVSDWFHQKTKRVPAPVETETERPSPSCPEVQIAWISLDEDDNDPIRFLTCLATAVDTLKSGAAASTMPLLYSQPLPPKAVVTSLIDGLGASLGSANRSRHYYALVMDDYHLITHKSVHESIAFLLECQPPWLHLTIVTRIDPPLPVPRLRARHQLTEIRADDLRFTACEAAAFLSQVMGLDLSSEDVMALEARTEGWIAGLQMAALSMQGRQDIPAFIKAFTGSHRYIIDYLIEEVFQRQSNEMRDFLLQTSILDRLCGPLCDAVTTQSNGQSRLEQLETMNLFLVPLDDERHWYRYHHLFRDVLRSRLQRLYCDHLPALHRRAADWYEASGSPEAAMHHLLIGNDFEGAERLLQPLGENMLTSGRWSVLLDWLDAIPETFVRSRPALCVLKAWALFLTGQPEPVESYLQNIEHLMGADLEDPASSRTPLDQANALCGWRGQVATLRSHIASLQGDITRAIEQSEEALTWLPQDNLLIRGIVATNLGFTYLRLDDWAKAERLLSEGRLASAASGNESMTLSAASGLGFIEIGQGHLHRAVARLHELLQQTAARLDQAVIGIHYSLSGVLYEWNDLAGALGHISRAHDLASQLHNSHLQLLCELRLAQIKEAQGDTCQATLLMHILKQRQSRATADQVALAEARFAVSRGDTELLEKFLRFEEEILSRPYHSERRLEYFTLVQGWLALSKLAEAEALLGRLQPVVQACGHFGGLIEFLGLQALLSWQRGDLAPSRSILNQVLALARPEGYVRTFVDLGPAMHGLLQDYRSSPDRQNTGNEARALAVYVDKLLAAFALAPPSPGEWGPLDASPHQQPEEPLSARELEVLHLMADGLSNRAIAETLFISVGTVKCHAHNIYLKLDVQSRTQAIARAREVGLLK
jgi:LuxR family transcriptional regulator, maltose regulon positive regulatory protein